MAPISEAPAIYDPDPQHRTMSSIDQLLTSEKVYCRAALASRKRVLQHIAECLATDNINDDELFDALMNRERLGSTGLGEGVAIPHCRTDCTSVRVAFVSLAEPIDYEASDGQPVDLLFAIVVPNEEQSAHLEALAALAQLFGEPSNRRALRACTTDDELHGCITRQLAAQRSAA